MPFNIFAAEGPSEEVLKRTKHVNSDSIICETLAILVQRTSDSGNQFTVHHCLYVWKKSKLVKYFHLHK